MKRLLVMIFVFLMLCGCSPILPRFEVVLPIAPGEAPPEQDKMPEQFYISEITDEIKERIRGVSFDESGEVGYADLRYVSVLHIDFDGNEQDGELIVSQLLAEEVLEIFYELYKAEYPINKMLLIDEYGGDDEKSMQDNNTSSFNYRTIAGTDRLSNHSMGTAIDINPLFNPYVKDDVVSPAAGMEYADREKDFAGKIDHEDLCYKLFTERGWTWGGDWSKLKDYQHFEKTEPQ